MKIVLKFFAIAMLVLNVQTALSQAIYKTDQAIVSFDAEKKNIEPIKAKNDQAKLIFNEENGEIACLIPIAQFEFPNKLMQEHFNENYLETDTYPKATLSGKIENFNSKDFSSEQQVDLTGVFAIHGKEQTQTVPVKISKKEDIYTFKSSFKIVLEDFNIKIPKVVFYKIAEEVKVSLEATLEKP